jgi:hypothetical protein
VTRPSLPPDVHEALVQMWTDILLASLQATPSPVAVWTSPAPDLDRWMHECCLGDDMDSASVDGPERAGSQCGPSVRRPINAAPPTRPH